MLTAKQARKETARAEMNDIHPFKTRLMALAVIGKTIKAGRRMVKFSFSSNVLSGEAFNFVSDLLNHGYSAFLDKGTVHSAFLDKETVHSAFLDKETVLHVSW